MGRGVVFLAGRFFGSGLLFEDVALNAELTV